MVFAGQRGAKEGREAVRRHLTHEPLDPVHLGHQQGQAAEHRLVPRLRRSPWIASLLFLDAGDQHRHDLALADDLLLTG
jgi:hypothetical protein